MFLFCRHGFALVFFSDAHSSHCTLSFFFPFHIVDLLLVLFLFLSHGLCLGFVPTRSISFFNLAAVTVSGT